jgi:hypothetical protein
MSNLLERRRVGDINLLGVPIITYERHKPHAGFLTYWVNFYRREWKGSRNERRFQTSSKQQLAGQVECLKENYASIEGQSRYLLTKKSYLK